MGYWLTHIGSVIQHLWQWQELERRYELDSLVCCLNRAQGELVQAQPNGGSMAGQAACPRCRACSVSTITSDVTTLARN